MPASLLADGQKAVNLYPEIIESGDGESELHLLPTPGLTEFVELYSANSSGVRGMIQAPSPGSTAIEHLYAVIHDRIAQITPSAGQNFATGDSLLDDGNPVSLAGSDTQLLIISGGKGYVMVISTLVVTEIADADFPDNVLDCAYSDGYFIVLSEDGNFYLSGVNDATSWDALDFASVASSFDVPVAIFMDHRQLIHFGHKITQFFNNTGASFPFEADSSGIVQMGIAARYSRARLDNTTFFLGTNENGGRSVYRFQGYTPMRVSDHALEAEIATYDTVSDAVAFGMNWQGHLFYRITFPTENKTWQYDVNTGKWTQLTYLNNGTPEAHLGLHYSFFAGKHLVGGRLALGTGGDTVFIYELSADANDDNGTEIQRIRRWPCIRNMGQGVRFDRFELGIQPGDGISGDPDTKPIVRLRWSDDGGRTWSSDLEATFGKLGDYRERAFWTRLGRSNNRQFEIIITDAVFVAIRQAYVAMAALLN